MTKRTLLSAALSLGLAATAFAQAPIERQSPGTSTQAQPMQQPDGQMRQHHHHNPHRQAAMLSRKLNLTPDQTQKLEPILASRDEQMRNLRDNTSLTPDQRHHEMRQIKRNTKQQLAGVLTPDQMQQMRAMHREHKMREQQQSNGAVPQAS